MKTSDVLCAVVALSISSCGSPKTCPKSGCEDGLRISLRQADGAPPMLALVVQTETAMIDCPTSLPPSNETGGYTACTMQNVFTYQQEIKVCTEGPGGAARCDPTGRFEQVLEFKRLTPKRVVVTAKRGDVQVLMRTTEPRYESLSPNGPDCPPMCMRAAETWDGI
jgi:hypothetical protein